MLTNDTVVLVISGKTRTGTALENFNPLFFDKIDAVCIAHPVKKAPNERLDHSSVLLQKLRTR